MMTIEEAIRLLRKARTVIANNVAGYGEDRQVLKEIDEALANETRSG